MICGSALADGGSVQYVVDSVYDLLIVNGRWIEGRV
jgi:hypothetical protein